MNYAAPSDDWQRRVEALWEAFTGDEDPERFRERVDTLTAELPDGHPVALYERAGAWDSTGHSDRAVPLYRAALEAGLDGYQRRRCVIQLASSLRNLGEIDESVLLLETERQRTDADAATATLNDAVAAFLALALADAGRKTEALSLALGALAPHLPRYQRSVTNYARALTDPEEPLTEAEDQTD
jgi:tetratricopeptide (TPR) repeat protein